jgi:uncharacterized membrane protein YbhN (UPF0104 family)
MFDEPSSGSARPRHLVIGVAAAVIVGVAVVTGVGTVAGFADLTRTVKAADFRWLAVCALGETAVFVGYAGTLRCAAGADDGPRLGALTSLRIVLASFAATQLVAFAGAAGLALVYWSFRRVGLDRHTAVVRVIGLNTAVYFVFGGVGAAGAAWALLAGGAPLGMTLPWLAAFPLIVVVARWFTDVERVGRWTNGERNGADDEPGVGALRLAMGTGVEAAAWVRTATGSRNLQPMFGWAALYWIGDIASLWAALEAFGSSPGLGVLVSVYATGYLAQTLPIPFIATGGVDAATAFLLHSVGVPLETALAAVVMHRVFAFWIPVVPGAVFATTLVGLGNHAEQTDAPEREAAPHPER